MVQILLGSVQEVQKLFSFPNNFNEVGYLEKSLEQTIEIWLQSSVTRDGYAAGVKVSIQGANVVLQYTGSGQQEYAKLLPAYLAAGSLALKGALAVKQSQKWMYNWRFLLPHGLSMAQHRTVQLLHFPPDYVLERDRDYLLAHTTLRWAGCLVENGAAAAETPRYQTIIDIAPIAAPSNAGQSLEGVYGNFSDYVTALFNLWLPRPDGKIRPMIAFGGPVKQWLKAVYKIDLKVLQTANIEVRPNLKVNVLGANHPSFIYNAVKETPAGAPRSTPLERGMRIMQQDLIAAFWQVKMAENPDADPNATLANATNHWGDPSMQRRICELTQEQAFDKSPDEAKRLCATIPKPQAELLSFNAPFHLEALDSEIDQIRDALGPLDGREPDLIQDL